MNKANTNNIFLRMHPLHRIIVSVLLSVIVFLLIKRNSSTLIASLLFWNMFALSYLILNWIVIAKRSIPEIRKWAKKDDGSNVFVFMLILISSFASMFTVLLLMVSQKEASSTDDLYLPLVIAGILLSWMMVHTIYAFHYAHLYYDDDEGESSKRAKGLDFPGNDAPEYLDFAYFAFVVGMTFQVSDVQITSPSIRRKALAHGLISFVMNTFVVALTINMIGSMS